MIIQKGFLLGLPMYAVSYKGVEVFNRDLDKAIHQLMLGF